MTGANNSLKLYAAYGGIVDISYCRTFSTNGAFASAIDGTSAVVTLKDCNLPSPTLTTSATLEQLTASPAFSTPVVVDGTTPDTIAVPGAQTSSVCSCTSPTALPVMTPPLVS